MRTCLTLAALAATLAILAGCGGDDGETGDETSNVAPCNYAIPGEVKLGGGRVSRQFLQAGDFGMLRGPGTFRTAQPAGSILDPEYKDMLIIKIPATVVGTDPVTVSVPPSDEGDVGLLYGSLDGYTVPFTSIDFEPCPGQEGTSWPGALAVSERGPVTLLVTDEGSDQPKRLVIR
jgi:hypothetical protein